jgi:hypothetical protein
VLKWYGVAQDNSCSTAEPGVVMRYRNLRSDPDCNLYARPREERSVAVTHNAYWTRIVRGNLECVFTGHPGPGESARSRLFERLRVRAAPLTAAEAHGAVVLGTAGILPYGVGWGTPHPREIFNGGVPSGRAWDLSWKGWGTKLAVARGLTYLYAEHTGGYAGAGAIEFRAYRIGPCSPGGPRSYTRLDARVAVRPGGPLGRWHPWGGWNGVISCQRQ